MDRRELLKLGAAAALSGCATAPRAVSPGATGILSEADIEATLTQLDLTIAKLAAVPPQPEIFLHSIQGGGKVAPPLPALDAPRTAEGHNLLQRTFAALHIATTFRELPPEVQAREDNQRRMWRAMPLLDSAMLDLADYLAGLSREERRRLQREIDRDPKLVMDIVGTLDEQAAHVGVPARQRAQLRAAGAQVSWRVAHQSVDALLGEMTDKVERVKERHGRDEELRRAIAAKVAEAQLFGAPTADATTHLMLAADVSAASHRIRDRRANGVLGAGGILLGIGAGLGIAGGVMVGSSGAAIGGLFVLTFAVLFGVTAIVLLIVGAILKAIAATDDVVPEHEPEAEPAAPRPAPPQPPAPPPEQPGAPKTDEVHL